MSPSKTRVGISFCLKVMKVAATTSTAPLAVAVANMLTHG